MDGERRCGARECQITGAVREKLRRPSLVVLIRGTNRSPCTAKRQTKTGTATDISHNQSYLPELMKEGFALIRNALTHKKTKRSYQNKHTYCLYKILRLSQT